MELIMVILRKSSDSGFKKVEELKPQAPTFQAFHPTTQSVTKTVLLKSNSLEMSTLSLTREA